MAQTLEQKIASKELEIARLKEQAKKLETGQKIIIGGMMLSLAKKDNNVARELVQNIKNNVDGKSNIKRIQPIIDELEQQIRKNQNNQQPQHSAQN